MIVGRMEIRRVLRASAAPVLALVQSEREKRLERALRLARRTISEQSAADRSLLGVIDNALNH